jgi:hypothetical protein
MLGTYAVCIWVTYDLQLDSLRVQVDRADFKVHADGGDVALCVSVVGEPQQKAGLSHAGVADKQQLEEVIAVRVCVCVCGRRGVKR